MPRIVIIDNYDDIIAHIPLDHYDLRNGVDQFKLVDAIREALGLIADSPAQGLIEAFPRTEIVFPPKPQPKPIFRAERYAWDGRWLFNLEKYAYMEYVHRGQSALP